MYSSGFSIIRWQSSGTSTASRSEATTGGPIVILGTKWPSMTSTWRRVAPPRTASLASSARRAKSADNMDGAISIKTKLLSGAFHQILAREEGRPYARWRVPLRLEEALDARPHFFLCELVAAFQLGFTELHGFNKAGLFFQIPANRFLRQPIRISPSFAGELCQFGDLLGVEMYFHGQRLEVTIPLVKHGPAAFLLRTWLCG